MGEYYSVVRKGGIGVWLIVMWEAVKSVVGVLLTWCSGGLPQCQTRCRLKINDQHQQAGNDA